jgi:hypothetical protein
MAEKGSNWLIDSMDHINSFLIWLGFRSHDITDRLGFCSMCDCSFWNVNLAYGAAESGFCTDGPDNRIVPYRISSTNLDSVRRFRFRKVHTVSMFPCTMGEHVVMAPCARLIILVWSYICRWTDGGLHGKKGMRASMAKGVVLWLVQSSGSCKPPSIAQIGRERKKKIQTQKVRWKPPEPDTIKINTDASFFDDTMSRGTGLVVRDHQGTWSDCKLSGMNMWQMQWLWRRCQSERELDYGGDGNPRGN